MLWQISLGRICGSTGSGAAIGGGGGGGGPAAAFLARTSGLDGTHVTAYTNLINGLVTDGIWPKLDMLHVYATQDSATALLNLVSSSFAATLSTPAPAFAADRGFTGANTTDDKYLDTHFNPTTASSPKFTQNSAHISAWSVVDNGSVNKPMMGLLTSGNETDIYPRYSDGNAYFRINSSNISGVATATPVGHYISNRSTSSAVQGYKNGSNILTNNSATSNAPLNNNFLVCAGRNNSTADGSPCQMAMASIGSSLNSTEAGNFYTRLRTYMIAIGAASAWQTTYAVSFTSDNTGWSGYNVRELIVPADLLFSGSQVRVTLAASLASGGVVIDHAAIGHASTTGSSYDFDGGQIALTFSGGAGCTIAQGASIVSDAMTFSLDKTKAFIVAVHFSGSSSVRTSTPSGTGTLGFYKGTADEVLVTDVSGYSSGNLYLVSLIEVLP